MLTETYRPRTLTEFIGQPKAVAMATRLMAGAPQGRAAILITGPSGTGKTTLARIIASSWADKWNTVECAGRAFTVTEFRRVSDSFTYHPMSGPGGRALIVNEVHTVPQDTIGLLLQWLDDLPKSTAVIFTTILEHIQGDMFGADTVPFRRRCTAIPFTNQGLADAMAERARAIAQAENLDGRPIAQYKRLVQESQNNWGLVLNSIASGAMLTGGAE